MDYCFGRPDGKILSRWHPPPRPKPKMPPGFSVQGGPQPPYLLSTMFLDNLVKSGAGRDRQKGMQLSLWPVLARKQSRPWSSKAPQRGLQRQDRSGLNCSAPSGAAPNMGFKNNYFAPVTTKKNKTPFCCVMLGQSNPTVPQRTEA